MGRFKSRDVDWSESYPLTMMTLWDGLEVDWRELPCQGVILAL